jgi:hypothetical protein
VVQDALARAAASGERHYEGEAPPPAWGAPPRGRRRDGREGCRGMLPNRDRRDADPRRQNARAPGRDESRAALAAAGADRRRAPRALGRLRRFHGRIRRGAFAGRAPSSASSTRARSGRAARPRLDGRAWTPRKRRARVGRTGRRPV